MKPTILKYLECYRLGTSSL